MLTSEESVLSILVLKQNLLNNVYQLFADAALLFVNERLFRHQ
jgi:hypothetical protein